jgi:hypothetical protein
MRSSSFNPCRHRDAALICESGFPGWKAGVMKSAEPPQSGLGDPPRGVLADP